MSSHVTKKAIHQRKLGSESLDSSQSVREILSAIHLSEDKCQEYTNEYKNFT